LKVTISRRERMVMHDCLSRKGLNHRGYAETLASMRPFRGNSHRFVAARGGARVLALAIAALRA
jgi:hypothetical protein